MSKAYDPDLIYTAQKLAKEMEIEHETHTGVYTCLGGPNYETVAELRMWKLLGVDAVGMSTVRILLSFLKAFINGNSLNRFTKSSPQFIVI